MATIHISEADAVRDFAGLMAHVRLGAEVVIESEARAVAIVRPAVPTGPGRLLSEVIAAAEMRGSSALLDGSFAHDLEEVINSHREPLNPPAWDWIEWAYRAPNPVLRQNHERFIADLLADMEVVSYAKATALLAGKIDGEQRAQGVTIPFSDLLIGATALEHGYAVATVNLRHFRLIPGLEIVSF